jgi:hypothetical protein
MFQSLCNERLPTNKQNPADVVRKPVKREAEISFPSKLTLGAPEKACPQV